MRLGRILGDDRLGALNDGRAVCESLSFGGLALLAGDLLAFLGGLRGGLDTSAQSRDVTDDVGEATCSRNVARVWSMSRGLS